MKILFRTKLNAEHLCLMAGPSPSPSFKRPFILHGGNIRAFIDQSPDFQGKYLFHRTSGRIGLSPEEVASHRQMATFLFDHPKAEEVFGAYIVFRHSADQVLFEISGASGHFGKPSQADALLAAGRIADLLALAGLSPNIVPLPYGIEVIAKH